MLEPKNIKYILTVGLIIILTFVIFRSNTSSNNSQIMAVFNGTVFIKNPPTTAKSRLEWWRENQTNLKEKYKVVPQSGFFRVPVMDFGEGYVELPHANFITGESEDDYICNNEIKTAKRCIKKNTLFAISGDSKNKISFDVDDGGQSN
ncbi:hypothetical protein BWI95_13005 [Kosakonia cowanii JCM 10956 = DSM 18146]|uniref:DUF943 family protein n=1 Tax=Kosakonia cowanii JCM 10956 = DSM 18146 TaxID=1300165 RepID=A0A807LEX9_9ENTR|nr:DUF943 family protein [Kosakonia cowanii]APZ05897.1 hypothetical protein BWI95_13005 [Kosakonia cowanii JCM 10956 = DSM 18146]